MRKQVAVALLLILGLVIPHVASAYSVPAGSLQKPQYTKPPQLPNPNDQCLGQDSQEQSEPCCGQDPIVINGLSLVAEDKLQDVLTNYSDLSTSTYYSNQGIKTFNGLRDRYELCFEIADPVNVGTTITIAPVSGETLAVYDLNLRPGSGLTVGSVLEVNSPKVVLVNLSMTDVVDGVLVKSETEIDNATITGATGGGGTCIEYNGANASGSNIKGSTISGCDVGILIDGADDLSIGSDTTENFYRVDGTTLMDANLITQNELYGIHLIDGHQNKFGYNLNYSNVEDAITIEDGMNDGILPPIVDLLIQDNEEYVLRCDKDANGNLVRRYIKFNYVSGDIQLYESDDISKQARKLIANCELSANGECDLMNLPSWVPVGSNQCGVSENEEYLITAIYTGSGSSALMSPKNLSGPIVIFAESGGVVIPTAPASDDEADITSGSQLSAEGGATEIAAVAAVGAKGGCMGGGASLFPNDISSTYAPHLGAWWIIFSIAFLASMRVAKARVRRRKK